MGYKKIKATNNRYEFNRDVFQNAISYSTILGAGTVTKLTSHVTTLRLNNGGPLTATARQIPFDFLVGNIPNSGVISIGAEYIRYASVTWVTALTGTLNECTRGFDSTIAVAHADLSNISHTNLFTYRDKLVIYNYTGADIFVGSNANITGSINSGTIADGVEYGVWLSPNVDLWVLSAGGGSITLVEYA